MTYTLVQQRTTWDCGVACVAMAAKRSYDEVLADVYASDRRWGRQDGRGLSESQTMALLRGYGLTGIASMRSYAPAFPALLVVPSLNHKATWHYVFWTGESLHAAPEVLDPQSGRDGFEPYTVDLLLDKAAAACSIMIFGEGW